MLLRVFLCLSLSLFALGVQAKDEKKPLQEDDNIRALMHSYYGSLTELKPFLFSEVDFSKKANKEKISKTLKLLAQRAAKKGFSGDCRYRNAPLSQNTRVRRFPPRRDLER